MPPDNPPEKLCIIRLSAIGDTCHTVPVVRAIQKAWPQTEITWIIGKTEHQLLGDLEDIRFVVLDKSKGLRGYADVRRQLAGQRFDLLLHMHASLRANLISVLVSAKTRLGFDRARARDSQWLFCNQHISARARQHVMDGLFEFTTVLGIESDKPRWDIPLSQADRELAEKVIDGSRPVLMISPCTGQRFRNYRNWSMERYAQVADYASRLYGAQILLTGGPTELERDYGAGISELAETEVLNLIGQTTLKQLLALVERAAVVVCPDSGPAHMATAVGTPVVGLYATSNRHRTGPYRSQHLVVDKYPEAVQRELGKTVSDLRWGGRVRSPDAMELITVPDVIEKLTLAFAERGLEPETGASSGRDDGILNG